MKHKFLHLFIGSAFAAGLGFGSAIVDSGRPITLEVTPTSIILSVEASQVRSPDVFPNEGEEGFGDILIASLPD